jgi:hypothetical protein
MIVRMFWLVAVALLGGALAGTPASAQELVYGNWTPPREYQNVHVMPEIFKNIEKETNGAIKWKLIAGGAIADGKGTFAAVKDGLMQAGLGIVTYAPNTIPSLYAIYSTVVLGHNDTVAATGAALEVLYLRCPSCLAEFRRTTRSRSGAGPALRTCWPAPRPSNRRPSSRASACAPRREMPS